MKTCNEYPEIPEFIVNLVKKAAADMQRLRIFSPQDREDHEQELVLHIWRHTQRNPAMKDITEDTVKDMISAYIALKKKELIRRQGELAEKVTFYPDIYDRPGECIEDAIALKTDLKNAVEKLSEQEKRIVFRLYHGFGLTEIAGEMGITPAAVHCHIIHIRKIFKREGLDSYLEPKRKEGN